MAKKKETTVEQKLRALYDLQLIDTRVDEIRNVRGELPLEVEDLENEIAGLETRLKKFTDEVADFDLQIKSKKKSSSKMSVRDLEINDQVQFIGQNLKIVQGQIRNIVVEDQLLHVAL